MSLIKLESIIRSEENLCYPQKILEECKYDVKNVKRSRSITDEFGKSASNESDNEIENESDDGSDEDDDEAFIKKLE